MDMTERGRVEADFTHSLLEATRQRKSWRERLQWIRDRFADPAFAPASEQLATIAIYLRLLSTGELRCEEDGGHFRPNHHAEAAQHIETALERVSSPETAWIVRRIYPYLPSWDESFRRSEPLTRIRDIAHRNDIPHDLKQEIKRRLQNKLHRCAGPEDLRTSEEILQRITAEGASYAPAFVEEFKVFHRELQEFFNATALEDRLRTLAQSGDVAAEAVKAFLALKAQSALADDQLLEVLERLTALRRLCAERMDTDNPQQRSRLRLADIGLEDYAFTLLSECANRLQDRPLAPDLLMRSIAAALDNLRLSAIEPDECVALHAELSAWASGFSATDRFHLLRLLATLSRTRRLAESYTDRILQLFPPRVEELGRALEVAEHAIKVFSEGDIRGHVIFQLSRLVELGLQRLRETLGLSPWEAIVPGEACGKLVQAASLGEVEGQSGPFILLLEQTDGDAEIPVNVKGIALGHPLPHLSHLGVRARQARVPFAACAGREHLHELEHLIGKPVRLRVTVDGPVIQEESAEPSRNGKAEPRTPEVSVPEAVLATEVCVLPLDRAETTTCGAKATGARRLVELAGEAAGLFRAPRGMVLPYAVMERCLAASPDLQREYQALQSSLPGVPLTELDGHVKRLQKLIRGLTVPEEIVQAVAASFGNEARLAVRSSANGEDLEYLAGAGIYESVVNVPPAAVTEAIREVWASLWTRRATVSRMQAGIAHERIHMAVLIQELVTPDLSFILHTVNPLTGNHEEAVAELAVGLGEVLASASVPGVPYRLTCNRKSGAATLSACATFSIALRPARENNPSRVIEERINYSRVALSADPGAAPQLGQRLAQVAAFLEAKLGQPQDVEGACVGEDVYIVQARPQQGL